MPPDPDAGVYLDDDGRPREPLPAERMPLSPEQRGEDDRLSASGVATRKIAWLGGGLLVFIAASLAALLGFYHLQVGDLAPPSERAFPEPRLETSIDPRSVPSSGKGPAQARLPVVPQPSAAILARAMQAVVARGAHAYDPLPSPTPAPPRPGDQS